MNPGKPPTIFSPQLVTQAQLTRPHPTQQRHGPLLTQLATAPRPVMASLPQMGVQIQPTRQPQQQAQQPQQQQRRAPEQATQNERPVSNYQQSYTVLATAESLPKFAVGRQTTSVGGGQAMVEVNPNGPAGPQSMNGWSVGDEVRRHRKRGVVEKLDKEKGILVRWPGSKRRKYIKWNKSTIKRLSRENHGQPAHVKDMPSEQVLNRRAFSVNDSNVVYALTGLYRYRDQDIVVLYKNGRWGAKRFYACPHCSTLKAHGSVDFVYEHAKNCTENDPAWQWRLKRLTERFNDKAELDAYQPPVFGPSYQSETNAPEDQQQQPHSGQSQLDQLRSPLLVNPVTRNDASSSSRMDDDERVDPDTVNQRIPPIQRKQYSQLSHGQKGKRRKDFMVDTAQAIAKTVAAQREKWRMDADSELDLVAHVSGTKKAYKYRLVFKSPPMAADMDNSAPSSSSGAAPSSSSSASAQGQQQQPSAMQAQHPSNPNPTAPNIIVPVAHQTMIAQPSAPMTGLTGSFVHPQHLQQKK